MLILNSQILYCSDRE